MGQVTISGSVFDVYSETADAISDAKIYLLAKSGSDAWTDAEKTDHQAALVSATRWVIRALAARGVAEASIPDPATTPADQFLYEATYESAFVLISDPTAIDQKNQGDNKKRLRAGSAEIEFFRPQSGGILPATAQSLILRYIDSLGLVTAFGALASGTDGESEFCDQDRYGRQEGFQ